MDPTTADGHPRHDAPAVVLTGCGILQKEIEFLIEKNGWPVEPRFLCSSLHVDFDRLARALGASLRKVQGRPTVVFYGACHPRIDDMLAAASAPRTAGQNCVEILLGTARFTAELEAGAFFLLEDWARRWEWVTGALFDHRADIRAAVFQQEHRCLLAVRTPCSGDFAEAAAAVSESVGLPLRWMDAGLDRLERALCQVLRAPLDGAPLDGARTDDVPGVAQGQVAEEPPCRRP